jgi:hypothetical protein
MRFLELFYQIIYFYIEIFSVNILMIQVIVYIIRNFDNKIKYLYSYLYIFY